MTDIPTAFAIVAGVVLIAATFRHIFAECDKPSGQANDKEMGQ